MSDQGVMMNRPMEGQIFAFQTRPFTEFSPPVTGRFAAIKILGVDANYIVVAVLNGIWPAAPSQSDISSIPVLIQNRFFHSGIAAVFGLRLDWWEPSSELEKFQLVGIQPVTDADRTIASNARGTTFAPLSSASVLAEGEWRWSNDRDAVIAEFEKATAKRNAERVAKEQRYRIRLRALTWDQLGSEIPFERWSTSPPFPGQDFTVAARAEIRNACAALQKLGPKPRRADVRRILRNTVEWFNEADEKAGGAIETEEREDICAVLEEMAFVARQAVLMEEVDMWRRW